MTAVHDVILGDNPLVFLSSCVFLTSIKPWRKCFCSLSMWRWAVIKGKIDGEPLCLWSVLPLKLPFLSLSLSPSLLSLSLSRSSLSPFISHAVFLLNPPLSPSSLSLSLSPSLSLSLSLSPLSISPAIDPPSLYVFIYIPVLPLKPSLSLYPSLSLFLLFQTMSQC